ncbi:putative lipoprotein [Burkholderia cepacia]|nr:putative lipoprotein [Burkholderia cepacia]
MVGGSASASVSASIGCWRTSARVSDASVDGVKVSVPNGRVGACY